MKYVSLSLLSPLCQPSQTVKTNELDPTSVANSARRIYKEKGSLRSLGKARSRCLCFVLFLGAYRSHHLQNKQLTRYLTHALVVLAAVARLLTVGITIADRLSFAVLGALVVPSGAAVGALSLPAARLGFM